MNRSIVITFILFFFFICYNRVQIHFNVQEINLLRSELEEKKEFECFQLSVEFSNDLNDIQSELDDFKIRSYKEFENTWKSFGTVRNNFISLGRGYHLETDDIAPEEFWKDDEK